MVQRGHVFAIVDEVDSILIDEARTPLIISGPADESAQLYYQFAGIARTLTRDDDYEVDEEKQTVVPPRPGIEKVEQAARASSNLYDAVVGQLRPPADQGPAGQGALPAGTRTTWSPSGEVKIVDEFTGRTLEGRRWSDGLHQAVEAKERVAIKEENHTWATVTLQNYFRLYEKLAGMTGTAETEASRVRQHLRAAGGPHPDQQAAWSASDQPDLVYKTEDAKFAAVVDDIVERHEPGQPVLVGTASVAKSEQLSPAAGEAGHAPRGPQRQAALPGGRDRGPGRPGGGGHRGHQHGRARRRHHPRGQPRGPGPARGQRPRASTSTPTRGQAELARRSQAEFEARVPGEGEEVRELGGLYVLGSERHECRRIDNQLRGRSGRQGDPGESRFFLSLEDELMRLFATGRHELGDGRGPCPTTCPSRPRW